jgi:hypothetical protein
MEARRTDGVIESTGKRCFDGDSVVISDDGWEIVATKFPQGACHERLRESPSWKHALQIAVYNGVCGP